MSKLHHPTALVKRLEAQGFDASYKTRSGTHVRCSRCEALVVNGTPTHEHGCPNKMHGCRGCNALIPARQTYCEDCR